MPLPCSGILGISRLSAANAFTVTISIFECIIHVGSGTAMKTEGRVWRWYFFMPRCVGRPFARVQAEYPYQLDYSGSDDQVLLSL